MFYFGGKGAPTFKRGNKEKENSMQRSVSKKICPFFDPIHQHGPVDNMYDRDEEQVEINELFCSLRHGENAQNII